METQNYIESLSTIGVLDRRDVLREKRAVSRAGSRLRAHFGARLLMEGGQDGRLHVKGRSRGTETEEICRLGIPPLCPAEGEAQAVRDYLFRLPGAGKRAWEKLKSLCGFQELVIVPAERRAARYMGSGTLMAAF